MALSRISQTRWWRPADADAADVHAGALADRLQPFENGDVFRGVVAGCHVYNCAFEALLLRPRLCTTIVAAFHAQVAGAAAAGGPLRDARDCVQSRSAADHARAGVRRGAAGGADDVGGRRECAAVGGRGAVSAGGRRAARAAVPPRGRHRGRDAEAVPRPRAGGGAERVRPRRRDDHGGRLSEGGSRVQGGRFSPISTARRRWRISASASPRRGTMPKREASGRRHSSTEATSRRSTSGSATRCCADTT